MAKFVLCHVAKLSKIKQMWHLQMICSKFAIEVNPFFRPVPAVTAKKCAEDGKVCSTRKVVVLLNKSIAYLPFSLPSPSSLRTFPNIACETVSKASVKTKITAEVVKPNQR